MVLHLADIQLFFVSGPKCTISPQASSVKKKKKARLASQPVWFSDALAIARSGFKFLLSHGQSAFCQFLSPPSHRIIMVIK